MKLMIIGLCGQSVFLQVPHFHRPEETLHALSMFTEPGGKGYNQAVAARRMGAEVVFSGAIGQDADGEACVQRLCEEGIEARMMYKAERTAFAAILTDDAGENRVTVFAGAKMDADDVHALDAEIREAGLLLLTPEIPESAFAKAVAIAKAAGVRIVINPAPFVPWVSRYLADAWLITPNRSEACAMLQCDETALMDRLAAAPYARMLVTMGSDGAVCVQSSMLTRIPAPKVIAVDTTGAGDCVSGVLCALLLEGMPLEEAAEKAVRAASLCVTRAHVLDGMPYARELEAERVTGGVR